MNRPTLLFISTRFLFPIDTGGKIRTTQILRGMKESGEFNILLTSPATRSEARQNVAELDLLCDEFEPWPAPYRSVLFPLTRMRFIFDQRPIPVRTDFNTGAVKLIGQLLARADLVVFDFLHSAVLAPSNLEIPSVLFSHNVEAEIFSRHIDAAKNPFFKGIWSNQYRKMRAYEQKIVHAFDVVIAVSERDAKQFTEDYKLDDVFCIPTGVDLEFFTYSAPSRFDDIVFCGSMDWMANQDAIEYFLDEIWPKIMQKRPQSRFTIVGRNPPRSLRDRASKFDERVVFTGYVDDVRRFIRGAAASVIPMRVGGGTRLKVYEAMAIGTPLVSTTIGVEGLPVVDGIHYLNADSPDAFADATVRLLDERDIALKIAEQARATVEEQFSFRKAAESFTQGCKQALLGDNRSQ